MSALQRLLSRTHTRMRGRGDDGSALVLALIVVLVVGALLAAVMDFTRAGLTLVPGERNDRNTNNYVQGAVQGAIDNIRRSSELGRQDVPSCPDFSPDLPAGTVPGVTGSSFVVSCTPQPTGSTAGLDQPRFAIQALGAAPEGVRQTNGNGLLYVNGGVHSAGVVEVGNGSFNAMRVNGTLTARSCTPHVTSTDLVGSSCAVTGTNAFDTAPTYAPAIADQSALQLIIDAAGDISKGADPVPVCRADRIEFEPGFYSEEPNQLVSRLMRTCSGKSVYHFKPGVYYFDYPGVWDIGATTVVGGTYLSSTLGSACSHDDAAPADGVQFLFGGSSQLYTDASASSGHGLELCGPAKAHALGGAPQRIALYGLSPQNTLASPAPALLTSTFKYTAGPSTNPVLSGTNQPFLLPTNARQIGESPMALSAQAVLLTNATSARLDYGKLTSQPPKGSSVTKVNVRVAQMLTGSKSKLRLSWPGGAFSEVNSTSCTNNKCDITSALAERDITWRSLAEVSISYIAEQSGTATVDGIDLEVTYRPPGLRAITCNTARCVFLQSRNNSNVFFHGTVFAPTAGLSVRIHNSGETLFDRGVVARDLQIDMSASSTQTTSPFQLPGGTPDGRLVLFRGKVDGVEKVRACVRYVDKAPLPDGSTSAYAGWSLTVPRWLVQRTPSAATAAC
jgi:hypothetical protein